MLHVFLSNIIHSDEFKYHLYLKILTPTFLDQISGLSSHFLMGTPLEYSTDHLKFPHQSPVFFCKLLPPHTLYLG